MTTTTTKTWERAMSKELADPIEVPDHVDHRDLYKMQVLQGRQIKQIERKINELEASPVVLSNFQKAVLAIFLTGCAWVLNATHQNTVSISAALATLTEINKKVDDHPSGNEIERRLQEIESVHPRSEPK